MISEEQEVSLTTRKTKGAKGGGTIRQRPDGRWEARYTLGIDPGTGKQIQKSVYGKTQKEAAQKRDEYLEGIAVHADARTMTVRRWANTWLERYSRGGYRNQENNRSIVRVFLDSLGDKAKSALDAVIGAFKKTSSASQTEGQKVGTGFATGMQLGLAKAPAVAMAASMMVGMALRSGYSSAYSSGAFIGQGFANGMMESLGRIRSAAAQMAAAADEAIRAKAKIGSPSKVASKLGSWFGEGFGNGIASMADFVRRATYDLVNIPTVATPDMAMVYSGTLSADYDYVRNNSYTIEVPVIVDGRETARATATYMQAELDQRHARNNRKLGRV